jgi:hypothetical protein
MEPGLVIAIAAAAVAGGLALAARARGRLVALLEAELAERKAAVAAAQEDATAARALGADG